MAVPSSKESTRTRDWTQVSCVGGMQGASVRNSDNGKGHEEGGAAYAKAGSSLRKPLFPNIYPQNQSLPTLLPYALTYTSDFMGGYPPPPLSEKELAYSSS